jgi:hypothetical protein
MAGVRWSPRKDARHTAFDADHVALAADGAIAQGLAGEPLVTVTVVFCDGGRRSGGRLDTEQPPAGDQARRQVAVCEPPIAADALEAVGQHVQQEAADELVGRERHGLVAGFVTVVLPLEQDRIAIKTQQPVIRDGDAMRVAAQVIEYLRGAAKRWFRVDDPLRVSGGREPGGERSRVTQRLELGGSRFSMQSGGLSGSRWGLRGTESLGGDLQALFVLESSIGSDNGTLQQVKASA